ncbi:helix-turn-helix domain-containing protein [Streptomyces sp. NPDC020965]
MTARGVESPDDDKLAVARARYAKNESVTAIAKTLGVHRATLYRHLGERA